MRFRFVVATVIALVLITSISSWAAESADPAPSSKPGIVAPSNDIDLAQAEVPRKFSRERDLVDDVPLLSWQSVALSLIVLVFGTYVVTLQYKLLLAAKGQPGDALRGLTVTTIVVLALAIVSSGFGRDQITPVLGLFGTIVGYLLGAGSRSMSGNEGAARIEAPLGKKTE